MKKGDAENKNGFTLIETVLVLAIAGLIFLMVFIALPALWRNTRDAERREDMATLVATIKKYQSNNRGSLPTSWGSSSDLVKKYLPEDFADPDGTGYTLTKIDCNTDDADDICRGASDIENGTFSHNVYIYVSATCDGALAKKSANPRKVAVMYKLEGGGAYCVNS